MVIIRLARYGKRKHPTYRFIVSDKRKDTVGTYLEALGSYNPHTTPPTIEVKADRLTYWLGVGAQLSDSVHNLLVEKGLVKAEKRTFVRPKKKAGSAAPASSVEQSTPAPTPVSPAELPAQPAPIEAGKS